MSVSALFSNLYLDALFEGRKKSWVGVGRAYMDRIHTLRKSIAFDAILIHCELFPYLPSTFETAFLPRDTPVLFDYDDAIFHQYDSHRSAFVRSTLGRKLRPLLKRTELVFCGNAYLRDYAAPFARDTMILPTIVDTEAYTPAPGHRTGPIGWIGSPSTWGYVRPYLPLLRKLGAAQGQPPLIVGSGHPEGTYDGLRFVDWSESGEIDLVRQIGVGIMPLDDAPWARGKCGYKLIQYLACGVPVVASPVGVNAEIVGHGECGYLAKTDKDWRAAIESLIRNPDLATAMGKAGRERIVAHYSLHTHGPRAANALRRVIDKARGPRT